MLKEKMLVAMESVVDAVCTEHLQAEDELARLQQEHEADAAKLKADRVTFEQYKVRITTGLRDDALKIKEREDAVAKREKKLDDVTKTYADRGGKIKVLEENQQALVEDKRRISREKGVVVQEKLATEKQLARALVEKGELEEENQRYSNHIAALEAVVEQLKHGALVYGNIQPFADQAELVEEVMQRR